MSKQEKKDQKKEKKEQSTENQEIAAQQAEAVRQKGQQEREIRAATAITGGGDFVSPRERLQRSKEALHDRRKKEAEEKERATREAENEAKLEEEERRGVRNLKEGLAEIAKIELLVHIGDQAYAEGNEAFGDKVSQAVQRVQQEVDEGRTTYIDRDFTPLAIEAARVLEKEKARELGLLFILEERSKEIKQAIKEAKRRLSEGLAKSVWGKSSNESGVEYSNDPVSFVREVTAQGRKVGYNVDWSAETLLALLEDERKLDSALRRLSG